MIFDVDDVDTVDDTVDEGELVRSKEPAEWSVVARHPTKNIVYDFKRQRKPIADGLKAQWEKRGFVVEVVYVEAPTEAAFVPSKASTTALARIPAVVVSQEPPQDPYGDFADEAGRLLRRCREADGLSLAQMCAKIQSVPRWDQTIKIKSVSGLSRMETGHVKMSMAQVAVFAEIFGLRPSEFIRLAEARIVWPVTPTGSTSTSSEALVTHSSTD
jgi:hypothetical protein